MSSVQKVIDIDVHNVFRTPTDLVAYLPEPWKSRIANKGIMDSGLWFPTGYSSGDCIPLSSVPAAFDPEYLVKNWIESNHMEYAILTGDVMNLCAHPDPDYAAAICSAYNHYLIKEWLPVHHSLKGAMVVASGDPLLAAREIDRIGGHPDIVEVLISSTQPAALGQRQFHPIYEAAARNGIPMAIHPGGEGSRGIYTSAAGTPTSYLEWHTCLSQSYMSHTVSLVCEGVFEKYPDLKFVMLEGGISWLPHLMWRLDKNYKALRSQVPWLKRMPSEYIHDHCFFSTQPMDEPDHANDLIDLLDMIDAENFLMFASDYPHWDHDAPTEILKHLNPEARQKILYDNAKSLYKL